MCSRLWMGSASTPTRPRMLVTAVLMRSPSASSSARTAGAGGGERLEDAHRQARVGAGGVDGEIGRVLQALDAGRVLSPIGQSLLPHLRLLLGELIDGDALLGRLLVAHPRAKVLGAQFGEGEHQVGQVALGVDDDRRDAIDGGFFQQTDAEAGLATPRHAHAHAVSDEVLRVVQEEAAGLLAGQIVLAAQVERAQLLKVFHGEGSSGHGGTRHYPQYAQRG